MAEKLTDTLIENQIAQTACISALANALGNLETDTIDHVGMKASIDRLADISEKLTALFKSAK